MFVVCASWKVEGKSFPSQVKLFFFFKLHICFGGTVIREQLVVVRSLLDHMLSTKRALKAKLKHEAYFNEVGTARAEK